MKTKKRGLKRKPCSFAEVISEYNVGQNQVIKDLTRKRAFVYAILGFNKSNANILCIGMYI